MALITPVIGHTIMAKLGNGATPEVFSSINLINTQKGISFSTSTETDELVDLADQGGPATTVRRVKATDLKIDGSGIINKPDVLEWINWAQSGEIRNVQITDGTWIGTGAVVLTAFQIDADRLTSSTCQITLEQAGPFVFDEV